MSCYGISHSFSLARRLLNRALSICVTEDEPAPKPLTRKEGEGGNHELPGITDISPVQTLSGPAPMQPLSDTVSEHPDQVGTSLAPKLLPSPGPTPRVPLAGTDPDLPLSGTAPELLPASGPEPRLPIPGNVPELPLIESAPEQPPPSGPEPRLPLTGTAPELPLIGSSPKQPVTHTALEQPDADSAPKLPASDSASRKMKEGRGEPRTAGELLNRCEGVHA